MAKKHKHQVKRSAKKAMKAAKHHKPLTAALVALGGFGSSLLASEKVRDATADLLGAGLKRATRALVIAVEGASDSIGALAAKDGDDEHAHAH